MFHEPAEKDSRPDYAIAYKTRLGLIMFFVYGLVYSGFVALNFFRPELMEKKFLLGLNLSIFYGFGLIVFALLMALVYNYFCSRQESILNKPSGQG